MRPRTATSAATIWLTILVGLTSANRLFPINMAMGATATSPVGNETVATAVVEEQQSENGTMRCDDARMRCAYRTGCGRALQHYLTLCASVLQGGVTVCPEICQHALIGLMSTDEGQELMTCECPKNDILCKLSKQRAEICRASVTATLNRTRVSCRVATWICNADALCSTALQYYNENCKRMFHGKKCTKRCRNSINILRRQEKAAKLNTCFCDGAEEYDCNAIRRNMDELCYKKPPSQQHNYQEQQSAVGETGAAVPGKYDEDTRSNRLPASAASVLGSDSASWRILLLGLALLLLHPVRPRRD